MSKQVKIKGVRRRELDYGAISYVLHQMAKRAIEEKRQREAEEKAARRGQRGGRS